MGNLKCFPKGFTEPFIQTPFSSLFGASVYLSDYDFCMFFRACLWPILIVLWNDCSLHVIIHRLAYQAFESLYEALISFHVGSAQWKITGEMYTFSGYPSLGSSMLEHLIWVRSSPLADYIDLALFFAKQVTPWRNALECRLNWANKNKYI